MAINNQHVETVVSKAQNEQLIRLHEAWREADKEIRTMFLTERNVGDNLEFVPVVR